MFSPSHFREERTEVLLDLIERFPLATVVSVGVDGLSAEHVPVYFEPAAGSLGKLVGHVAKANSLWQTPEGQEVLLVFQGASSYISPNWYASKKETGKDVPTWNYAVVHVHATVTAIREPEGILGILENLTARHEAGLPHPWKVEDAPQDFTRKLLAAIVGVEFAITRIQGKWKVSQNHPAGNQRTVIDNLLEQGTDAATQMADMVKAFGKPQL